MWCTMQPPAPSWLRWNAGEEALARREQADTSGSMVAADDTVGTSNGDSTALEEGATEQVGDEVTAEQVDPEYGQQEGETTIGYGLRTPK